MPKIVLLAGGTVAVGWLAVKSAAVDALVKQNPYAAAAFAPDDPRVPVTLAMAEFKTKQGAVSPALARQAIASIQDAPLTEEPFLLAALDALVRGDGAKAERLLEEARARNPRSQLVHILLLDRYLRTDRLPQATAEIGAVAKLVPDATRVLIPHLASFATGPKTSASLALALRSEPGIRHQLLEHLASRSADVDLILRIASTSGAPPAVGKVFPWQQLVINSLVEKGEVERAQELWTRFSRLPVPEAGSNIYDGRFEGRPGPPPFNWVFTSSPAGVAEPTKGPALQVEYYGRAEAAFATQLLRLDSGRYQIAFTAFGNAPQRGSSLSWRIVCHPGGVEIAAIPVKDLSYSPKQIKAQFTVPASGCEAQWLRLVGTPAEFPTAHSVTISNLQLGRAARS